MQVANTARGGLTLDLQPGKALALFTLNLARFEHVALTLELRPKPIVTAQPAFQVYLRELNIDRDRGHAGATYEFLEMPGGFDLVLETTGATIERRNSEGVVLTTPPVSDAQKASDPATATPNPEMIRTILTGGGEVLHWTFPTTDRPTEVIEAKPVQRAVITLTQPLTLFSFKDVGTGKVISAVIRMVWQPINPGKTLPARSQNQQTLDPKVSGNPQTAPQEAWKSDATKLTGKLVFPDGTPAAATPLQIGTYVTDSEWKVRLGLDTAGQSWDHGRHPNWTTRAVTDAEGRFEAHVPPTSARSWVRVGTPSGGSADPSPVDVFAPFERDFSAEQERARVLDAGTLKLEHGVILRGRVVDADDRPLSNVVLRSSDKLRPYAARETRSLGDGSFVFAPHHPSVITLSVDARLRDVEGKVISRDVQAVFATLPLTLADTGQPLEVNIRAMPHVTLEFEWIDRREPPSDRVSYYNTFEVSGTVASIGNEPVSWSSETEKVTRDGRQIISVKVPRTLLAPCLTLPTDTIVRATYQEGDGPVQGPGVVDMSDIAEPERRIIYADPPKARTAPSNR